MAKNIVPAKEIKAWYLDPKTILWWHQVIAAPDVNNNKVFNSNYPITNNSNDKFSFTLIQS